MGGARPRDKVWHWKMCCFRKLQYYGGAGTGVTERSLGVFVMKTPSRMLTAAVSLPWLVDLLLPLSSRDVAASLIAVLATIGCCRAKKVPSFI
jgi:hypothetical protein